MGMTLGTAMFSGVAGLRHLVQRRKPEGDGDRSSNASCSSLLTDKTARVPQDRTGSPTPHGFPNTARVRQPNCELSLLDDGFPMPIPVKLELETANQTQNIRFSERTKSDEYARLKELLTNGKYEEADRETWQLMQRISGAHQRGYFEIRDFEEFPTVALQTLDRLWIEASEGRFGLSVQKRIYREEDRQYDRLGARVGWVNSGKWLTSSDESYRPEIFPEGHLPLAMWRSQLASFGFFGLGMCLEVFLSREDF